MKKVLILAFMAFTITATAQTFPQPSPMAKTYQMVGLTGMEVEYSSPGKKDREIFGDLVPYNELWRTGANSATKITFDENVTFGGEPVKAGTYAMFTIPKKDEFTVILNSNPDQGGTGDYDEAKDVARVKAKAKDLKEPVERMRFTFENTTNESTDLVLSWADKSVTVPITTNTEELAMVNFKKKQEEYENRFNTYNSAANYYLDAGELEKAMKMGEQSVEMKARFYNTHTLAKIYHQMGMNEKAMKQAEKSMKMARDADYQPYIRLNEKLMAEMK
jgi:hypothetical protein